MRQRRKKDGNRRGESGRERREEREQEREREMEMEMEAKKERNDYDSFYPLNPHNAANMILMYYGDSHIAAGRGRGCILTPGGLEDFLNVNTAASCSNITEKPKPCQGNEPTTSITSALSSFFTSIKIKVLVQRVHQDVIRQEGYDARTDIS